MGRRGGTGSLEDNLPVFAQATKLQGVGDGILAAEAIKPTLLGRHHRFIEQRSGRRLALGPARRAGCSI